MRKIVLFIGVVFIALETTAQEYLYIIEKDSYYLQEKVAVAVSDVDSITFVAPNECMENGYEWVDLGLSVKWATCNVGATKPEEYGNYYAWGETTPKSIYNWSTYKWCNGSYDTMTKYCTDSDYGTVDNKTTLDPEDDAAAVNMGGSWRMPTYDELEELKTKCTWTWTTLNGVNGYNVEGPNGNSIFLPAAGWLDLHSLISVGSYARYWSSSGPGSNGAYNLLFNSDYVDWGNYYRYYGRSVRPVLGE